MLSLLGATILLNIISPFLFLFQSLRQNFTSSERRQGLGYVEPYPSDSRVLWIHGYSLGELTNGYNALLSLIQSQSPLLDQFNAILFTTSTANAARVMSLRISELQQSLPSKILRSHLVPLDSSHSVARFLDSTPVAAGIFIESDLWPILLTAAASRGVPLALLNARMSELESWLWYNFAPSLAKNVLSSFKYISAETEQEAARISKLSPNTSVRQAKSLKFLASENSEQLKQPGATAYKDAIGSRPVWVAASTHLPDEPYILEAHRQLITNSSFHDAVLIIAPRHPQDGKRIVDGAFTAGFKPESVLLRSSGQLLILPDTAVYVADTLGELPLFYEVSRVAFIGNSFASSGGGHNFAEAAHFGVCVIHGPYFDAFTSEEQDIKQALKLLKGNVSGSSASFSAWTSPCMEARGVDDLVHLVTAAFQNPIEMTELGATFREAVQGLGKDTASQVSSVMEELTREKDQINKKFYFMVTGNKTVG